MTSESMILQKIETSKAIMPEAYNRAVIALQECNQIDECKEWADKMSALASYWKQANDETMYKLAKRIHARAYRRAGELLKQFDARPQNAQKQKDGDVPLISQKDVAEQNGMSERQRKTAVRLANVPDDSFNDQVESDNFSTITQLAEQGKRDYLSKPKPQGFAEAIQVEGAFRDLVNQMEENDPIFIIGGMDEKDISKMKEYIRKIENWCDTFMVNV